MITNQQQLIIIESIIKLIELPDSAYDKARKRYEDLGKWFDRRESLVSANNPHIFPQGSFRLGTAIRPLDEKEEYDLDLACKLRDGVTKSSHTQKDLKMLIGAELEAYRGARGIKNKLEAKHRCWRLQYQDDLSFHMDIVPCILADEDMITESCAALENFNFGENLAKSVSAETVNITDDRSIKDYEKISTNWHISNPEGYARWFEARMQQGSGAFGITEKAQVDEVPDFVRKTILQRIIQFLKRHRDSWGKSDPDSKPISIIITTLASKAYSGETNIVVALSNVLKEMGNLVNKTRPRIPNPVDPKEDFADRWYRPDSSHLRLEVNFNNWLLQAQMDFDALISTTNTTFLCEQIQNKLSLRINETTLKEKLGVLGIGIGDVHPKSHTIEPQDLPKPWRL